MELPIMNDQEKVGTCMLKDEGLYWYLQCDCRVLSDRIERLYATERNLGVLEKLHELHVHAVICDGAKASCAGKIALAVDNGILGYEMYCQGQQFEGGDGIVKKGVENTINNFARLGKKGMSETDREILRMMIE